MQAQIMYLKPGKSAILKNFHKFKAVTIFFFTAWVFIIILTLHVSQGKSRKSKTNVKFSCNPSVSQNEVVFSSITIMLEVWGPY